jgi:hypothetical protein
MHPTSATLTRGVLARRGSPSQRHSAFLAACTVPDPQAGDFGKAQSENDGAIHHRPVLLGYRHHEPYELFTARYLAPGLRVISASARERAARPSAVRESALARSSPFAADRTKKPLRGNASTAALMAGLPSANRAARRERPLFSSVDGGSIRW